MWVDIRNKYFPDLTESEKSEKIKSGKNRFYDRTLWAKTYLFKAGLVILIGRGVFRITDRGQKALTEKGKSLTVKDLYAYAKFTDWKVNSESNTKKGVDNADTPSDLLEKGISEIEEQTKVELLNTIKKMDPYIFEEVILKLLKKMGYGEYIGTKKSGDGGIDGILNQDQLGIEKIYIQVKRFNDNKISRVENR